jgi:hypothetical protein
MPQATRPGDYASLRYTPFVPTPRGAAPERGRKGDELERVGVSELPEAVAADTAQWIR